MLRHFFATTWRYLYRNLSFTIINLIGLTVGIAAFLLIALYLQQELSYDSHLPEDARLYRMVGIQEPAGIDVQHVAITSGGWAPYINRNIPGVEEAFRLQPASPSLEVDGEIFREQTGYGEGRVLHFLGLSVNTGLQSGQLLAEPNTAVVSKETALRIYKTTDVIGKTFRHDNRLYAITGVFDNNDLLTHLRLDVLMSLTTVEQDAPYFSHLGNNSVITYLALTPDASVEEVENQLNSHYRNEAEQETGGNMMSNTFYLQDAEDIYLGSGNVDIQIVTASGDIRGVYVFALIAILVLAIACINFINLSTANAARRAREVGVRKVLGAGRGKLALQFVSESLALSFVAVLLSLVLLEVMIPEFNMLLGSTLHIDFVRNPLFNVGLLGILLVVGLLSGLYPGIFMSRFRPAEALKSGLTSGKPKAVLLRKILVIFQFVISTGLIFSTIVVLHQVRYMQEKDRGYEPENTLYMHFDDSTSYEGLTGFSNLLKELPEVQSVGLASNYNGVAGRQSTMEVMDSVNTRQMVRYGYVNPDFFPTMGMDIVEGRNFSHEAATDPHEAAIVNEATCRVLGWENPIGKRILNPNSDNHDYYTVVGVVKDYNYYNVRLPIQPAFFLYEREEINVVNIRYQTENTGKLLEDVEQVFTSYFPGHPFRSNFVNEVLDSETRDEENTMKLFLWFSVLCIVISCLGLFGLTAYMMNQRRKEISIRKVLGATTVSINVMLVGAFLRVVLMAVLISLPFAYLVIGRWLNNYPYRIDVGVLHFGISISLILLIATLTVLFYSSRAARQNPVKNLNYE
ncbi:MAG: FtsX-like permease family protein [Bacteroidales bacterium]